MSGIATAMLMAVIVENSYLSGTLDPSLHLSPRYSIWNVCIVTFHHFAKGDTDTTWSYGLPNIAEKNLYSNLCLCHGICIIF